MKTAISIPDETFRRVEDRAAELKMNRSQFFTAAAERYLAELDSQSLVHEINSALERGGNSVAADAAAVADEGRRRLAEFTSEDEW
jgi:predicted DNA-binding protein